MSRKLHFPHSPRRSVVSGKRNPNAALTVSMGIATMVLVSAAYLLI